MKICQNKLVDLCDEMSSPAKKIESLFMVTDLISTQLFGTAIGNGKILANSSSFNNSIQQLTPSFLFDIRLRTTVVLEQKTIYDIYFQHKLM